MPGVVIVTLGLDPGVRQVLDPRAQADPRRRAGHHLRQLQDRELLRKLIEDTILPRRWGVGACQFHTAHGVADVEEAAGLMAGAIDADRLATGGLDAEPVQRCAEDLVVVQSVNQRLVALGLSCDRAIDHALVQIRSPQPPDLAGEHDVVAVVDLGQVIERPRLFGVWQSILAPVVLYLDETFLDIDIGRAVLAHGAQLDQVAFRGERLHGEENVQRADQVGDLGGQGVGAVDHGEGRRALLGEMDDGVGCEVFDQSRDEVVIGHIADPGLDRRPTAALPGLQPFAEAPDRRQGRDPQLPVPGVAHQAVGHAHAPALGRQMQGCRPAAIAVAAQHQHPSPLRAVSPCLEAAHRISPPIWSFRSKRCTNHSNGRSRSRSRVARRAHTSLSSTMRMASGNRFGNLRAW